MRTDSRGRRITKARHEASLKSIEKARAARWSKPSKAKPQKSNGVSAAYGREVLLQVPIGKHETRTMTIKQASVMYRHLRAMHWMLK